VSDVQQELKELMPLALTVVMFAAVDNVTRMMTGPKLEKKLGRPLTEWDWQIYWEEEANKQECLAWAYTFIQLYRGFLARETIRRFVWEEEG